MTGYDVAILGDLRHAADPRAALAAEVRSQAAAGRSTVLVHVPSPHPGHDGPFHEHVIACLRDGLADLAHGGDPGGDVGGGEVHAELLVLRQPRIFAAGPAAMPAIRAARTVLVVDEPPGDDLAAIRDRAERCFGAGIVWAPADARVREHLRRTAPDLTLRRGDWTGPSGVGPAPRAAPPAGRPPRALLVGDRPDRLLAVARRLPTRLEPVLVTGSATLPATDLLVEHLPEVGAGTARRERFRRDRLRHLIDLHAARTVVLDGLPHDGVLAATADHPDVAWLWLRGAMWRRGDGVRWRGRAAAFDGVLEPGEFAAPGDEGWTVTGSAATTVAPITFFDRAELRPPPEPAGEPALLLRGVPAAVPGFRVVDLDARALRGADLAVSAADYTSFHELLAAGVPTVFVPDPAAADDQLARARFAAAAGVALHAERIGDLDAVLARAARPEVRAALTRRCAEVAFGNGAAAAADWVASFGPAGVRAAA
jgi:hypothetical protein